MALRHSGDTQRLCRKLIGVSTGFVCDAHEGRCVICDAFTEMAKPAKICDDCGFQRKSLHSQMPLSNSAAAANTSNGDDKPGNSQLSQQQRCIVCNRDRASDVAYYCRSCVLLEKDRDGCPVVLNLSGHQQLRTIGKGSVAHGDLSATLGVASS